MFRDQIAELVEKGLPRIAKARDAYGQSLVGWTNSAREVLQEAREGFRSKIRSVEDSLKVDAHRSCRLELKVAPVYLSERGDQAERDRTYRLGFVLDTGGRTIRVEANGPDGELFDGSSINPQTLDRTTAEHFATRFIEAVLEDLEQLYKRGI